ncbi:MAG: hypothetical protein K6C95_09250, partial [Lachnospiraceae bacterium]|nr:hypothetical protein [Lachnospiraceae bacterium]
FTNDNAVANVEVYTYKPEKHDVDDTEVTIDKYARTLTYAGVAANTTAPGNVINVTGQKKDNSFYVRIYNDSATDVTGKIRVIKP